MEKFETLEQAQQAYDNLKADNITLNNNYESLKNDFNEKEKLVSEHEKTISDLKETNMNLYLRIPQQPHEDIKKPEVPKQKSYEDIIKEMRRK